MGNYLQHYQNYLHAKLLSRFLSSGHIYQPKQAHFNEFVISRCQNIALSMIRIAGGIKAARSIRVPHIEA